MKWIIIAFFALYLVGYTLIHNTPLGLVLLFILLLAVGGLVLYYKYRLKDRFRVVGTVEEELKKADSLGRSRLRALRGPSPARHGIYQYHRHPRER